MFILLVGLVMLGAEEKILGKATYLGLYQR